MPFRIALCAVLCLTASLRAQVATGTIVGVVEDATGALIPNAQVTILHVATAESRQTRSNERGEFSLPYVHIGDYSVTVEAAGFKKETLTGIELKVDQTVNLRLRELMLPVLVYPIMIPALMGAILLTNVLMTGDPPAAADLIWFRLLVAFDVIFTILSLTLVDTVLIG